MTLGRPGNSRIQYRYRTECTCVTSTLYGTVRKRGKTDHAILRRTAGDASTAPGGMGQTTLIKGRINLH